jgi:hypothetical protein
MPSKVSADPPANIAPLKKNIVVLVSALESDQKIKARCLHKERAKNLDA